MNWKIVVVGGILIYLVVTVIGMFILGPTLHNGLLKADYQANSHFWRPALNQEPPEMGELFPRWIATTLLWAFVVAGLYSCVRGSFSGPGWKKGMTWGFCLAILNISVLFLWSGIFNLPDKIWTWWGIEGFINLPIACSLLGLVAEKLAPEG